MVWVAAEFWTIKLLCCGRLAFSSVVFGPTLLRVDGEEKREESVREAREALSVWGRVRRELGSLGVHSLASRGRIQTHTRTDNLWGLFIDLNG